MKVIRIERLHVAALNVLMVEITEAVVGSIFQGILFSETTAFPLY